MNVKKYFWILVVLILALAVVLGLILFQNELVIYFLIVEGLVIALFLVLALLYKSTVRPLKTISLGLGVLREEDLSTRLSQTGTKEVDAIIFLFNRMMDQLRDKQIKLKEQNYFLDLLISSSPMGIIILDLDYKIYSYNPAALNMLSQEHCRLESLASSLLEHSDPISVELLKLEKNESKIIRLDNGDIYKCSRSSFINSGYNQTFYLIERMTEEVLQAERKAYEHVIRMLAHEVNNSMAGISSSIDIAKLTLQELEKEKLDEQIFQILSVSAERCLNLSRFVSRYADVVKIPEPVKSRIELNTLVTNNLRLYESLARGKDILFELRLNNEPVEVEADIAQIEQVLINIVKNALEAIDSAGTIIIATTESSLLIMNDGQVLDSSVSQHLFSPFFSTKPNGQGIGLLVVRDILNKHAYRFSLRTQDQGLTCFSIYF